MFKEMKLPYKLDALEPFMSRETLEYHYSKHYKGYVKNLNKLIKGTVYEDTVDTKSIIRTAKGPIFNNAAQVYNHEFFFNCLSENKSEPVVEETPKGKLLDRIENQWGSFEEFKEDFTTQAKGHFGSGWCYFYLDGIKDKLLINTFHDAENPLALNLIKIVPLLVVDLWEHAFYLMWKNDKEAYLNSFWKLVNWEFVNKTYNLNV